MKILAFETTCDETSAAVLEGRVLRSNSIFSQIKLHRKYSGVVPELASRAHLEKIPFVLGSALGAAGARVPLERGSFDAVAFSRGPGLPGALMVGRVAAEAAAELAGAPLIGVNHLEGHLLACEFEQGRVARPLEFPLLALIVSGGHTEIWHAKGYGDYRVIGRTRDDAAGEAFDKVAKLLGLPYPGGPAVEKDAARARGKVPAFPRPFMPGTWDFSFSGLKTAVSYYLAKELGQDFYKKGLRLPPARRALVCRAFQDSVCETLVKKAADAARSLGLKRIAVGGGVSANGALRAAFAGLEGLETRFSEKAYCSDNAAMIALCALRRLQAGKFKNSLRVAPELATPGWKAL
ncbi:MAG: tRNA (adenosine(37)-N6)-threonylcarbamoyltransferase complex transferase subunit TsaD [Elusimicrobia bacterium GWA2_61_42]|nr:MAG: tRNA (adenosine(37)-N6)-threonylcarbamoyltransferase complex transferase subunit TsaD [Elusimicrobia bacterium GWA2_61_42]OGR75600.1 MAG: tRNA (adenosine(37)-N6)-threonylcarbamoyltransferase complex transferase subunit TsaD [Elusimicrobia bacterium GWC2_61_25]